jgi:choline dehydrogenase
MHAIFKANLGIPDGHFRYHATGGYLDVGRFPYRTKSAYAFMEAAASVGLPETDINGVNMIGSMFYPVTLSKNGRRASSASAFLRPAKKRPNLRVVVKAMVSRVLLEQQGGYGYGGYGLGGQGARAVGVVFHRHGKAYRVKCRREVILSAGALESPKLLMLSGELSAYMQHRRVKY